MNFNEDATSTTTVTGVDYTNANASHWPSRNGQQLADQLSAIDTASDDLTAALTTLRSEAQTLSANLSTVQIRQDFTKATINTLQNGSAALTLANSNQEGANLLALQTRQQLSTTALSLSAQADQNVLRLFQ